MFAINVVNDIMHIEEISFKTNKAKKTVCTLEVDCTFYHYLYKEFKLSAIYRINFCKSLKNRHFRFILLPTKYDLIDYKWNDRVTEMARERCELEHALSWLSTLGGAFSALGDYYTNCALIAGKISVNQLKLALRIGDPLIASRCRLYYSLSLIQQQRFKFAKYLIYKEYETAKNSRVVDERLLKICKGIWSKLQYEYKIFRSRKKLKEISLNK